MRKLDSVVLLCRVVCSVVGGVVICVSFGIIVCSYSSRCVLLLFGRFSDCFRVVLLCFMCLVSVCLKVSILVIGMLVFSIVCSIVIRYRNSGCVVSLCDVQLVYLCVLCMGSVQWVFSVLNQCWQCLFSSVRNKVLCVGKYRYVVFLVMLVVVVMVFIVIVLQGWCLSRCSVVVRIFL